VRQIISKDFLVSVAPLVFLLLAPEAVLEQENEEHNDGGNNSDGSGNGVASASLAKDVGDAALGGVGGDGKGEPEESRLAHGRALVGLLKLSHGLDVSEVLVLVLLGVAGSQNLVVAGLEIAERRAT